MPQDLYRKTNYWTAHFPCDPFLVVEPFQMPSFTIMQVLQKVSLNYEANNSNVKADAGI